jgi:glycosyltransferase involved in cell wall biosynthesis
MFTYAIAVAVICGCHRIWNYEDVFAGVRKALGRLQFRLWPWGLGWLVTPLICPACNAFWIGAVIAAAAGAIGVLDIVHAASLPLAAYPVIRALVWLYAQPLENLTKPHQCAHQQPPQRPHPASPPAKPDAAAGKPGCSSCGQQKKELEADRAFSDKFSERVVLMTALADFDPSYSLVSVIFDQARALARNPERLVQVWVMRSAKLDKVPEGLPANVQVKPYVPDTHWQADVIDAAASNIIQRDLLLRLFNLGNAKIITHDLMLVDSYTTFAAALHEIGKVKAFSWVHQIHSCVGPRKGDSVRTTLPPGHLLAVINPTEVEKAAAYYNIDCDRVVVIPNSRDVATWGTTVAAQKVLEATALLQADIAQVFPLSLPRAHAKGLDHVIRAHGAIRALGKTTALVVVDAHANAVKSEEVKTAYRDLAREVGVTVTFTSDIAKETAAVGLNAASVRALFAAANVFVLPSLSESSGLVALEAVVSGNSVWVNSNVPALSDLAATTGGEAGVHSWPFPSQLQPEVAVDYGALATAIVTTEDAIPSRRHRRLLTQDLAVPALTGAVEAALARAQPIP